MMYVVLKTYLDDCDFEIKEFLGVFTTYEKAQSAADAFNKGYETSVSDIYAKVEEVPVNAFADI